MPANLLLQVRERQSRLSPFQPASTAAGGSARRAPATARRRTYAHHAAGQARGVRRDHRAHSGGVAMEPARGSRSE